MLASDIEILGKHFKKQYGVYAWVRDGKYLYIGRSSCVYQRLYNHDVIGVREAVLDTDVIQVWLCSDAQSSIHLENRLISQQRPYYNSEGSIYKELFAERTVSAPTDQTQSPTAAPVSRKNRARTQVPVPIQKLFSGS